MAGQLDGKIVVITGAGGGVGSAVSQQVAATGAKLALFDHRLESIESLDLGGAEALKIAVDLTNEADTEQAVQQVVDQYGQIDALMHIAGGFAMPGPVHEGHLDIWHRQIALNATAFYITMSKVAASMVEKGIPGSLVGVSARAARKGGANGAAYAASKAAAVRIMESMAAELKLKDIRVNTIAPSTIDTPANREAMGTDKADKWVKPEQIADLMIFLVSDAAVSITGTDIEISGKV